MKYLIVYTHPNPDSFNHAIRETIVKELKKNKKEFKTRDLYEIGFDPALSAADLTMLQKGSVPEGIKAEQDYIRSSDTIIFIYPLWWGGLPAMLKGYIDRVFTEGFAYKITENGIEGLLKGKKVFLVTTIGASKEDYEKPGFFKSMGHVIDWGIFEFCGLELISHKYFCSVPYVTDSDRKAMLEELVMMVRDKLL